MLQSMPDLASPTQAWFTPNAPKRLTWDLLDSSVDVELMKESDHVHEQLIPKLTTPPDDMVPFVLAASEGERMIAGDQVYTILGSQRHSNGAFISLLTEGPIGTPIPRHQHERVTELFYCLNGAMEMFAGDGFSLLHPGDFPACPSQNASLFSIEKARHSLSRLRHSGRLRAVLPIPLRAV